MRKWLAGAVVAVGVLVLLSLVATSSRHQQLTPPERPTGEVAPPSRRPPASRPPVPVPRVAKPNRKQIESPHPAPQLPVPDGVIQVEDGSFQVAGEYACQEAADLSNKLWHLRRILPEADDPTGLEEALLLGVTGQHMTTRPVRSGFRAAPGCPEVDDHVSWARTYFDDDPRRIRWGW